MNLNCNGMLFDVTIIVFCRNGVLFPFSLITLDWKGGACDSAVVKALWYKPDGRLFETR
jgi:hypothetical protein